jgi:hypothetical protein
VSVGFSLKSLDTIFYDINKEGNDIPGKQPFLLVIQTLTPHYIAHIEIWKVLPQFEFIPFVHPIFERSVMEIQI